HPKAWVYPNRLCLLELSEQIITYPISNCQTIYWQPRSAHFSVSRWTLPASSLKIDAVDISGFRRILRLLDDRGQQQACQPKKVVKLRQPLSVKLRQRALVLAHFRLRGFEHGGVFLQDANRLIDVAQLPA